MDRCESVLGWLWIRRKASAGRGSLYLCRAETRTGLLIFMTCLVITQLSLWSCSIKLDNLITGTLDAWSAVSECEAWWMFWITSCICCMCICCWLAILGEAIKATDKNITTSNKWRITHLSLLKTFQKDLWKSSKLETKAYQQWRLWLLLYSC